MAPNSMHINPHFFFLFFFSNPTNKETNKLTSPFWKYCPDKYCQHLQQLNEVFLSFAVSLEQGPLHTMCCSSREKHTAAFYLFSNLFPKRIFQVGTFPFNLNFHFLSEQPTVYYSLFKPKLQQNTEGGCQLLGIIVF